MPQYIAVKLTYYLLFLSSFVSQAAEEAAAKKAERDSAKKKKVRSNDCTIMCILCQSKLLRS